jgi:2-polyprenyl-3-methyl-5-hydroxy-6-metoxy-1,4-benzoquinol methylase
MAAITHHERAKRFFADPSRYIQNNPYIDLRAKLVREMLPHYARKSILDLGAGDGRISIPLVGENDDLLMVDSSARMLDMAMTHVPPRAAAQVRALCTNVADFVTTGPFDVVLCLGLLAHVDDWAEVVRLVARSVAPKGCALIQVTDRDYWLGRLTLRVAELNRRFFNRSLHTLNPMTLRGVESELLPLGLTLKASRRYALVYGTRLAPRFVARAAVALASSAPLAEYGGEVFSLFVRD